MLESLEGRRGVVRAKPPLPAHKGLVRSTDCHQQRPLVRDCADHRGQGRGLLQRFRHGPLTRHYADPACRQSSSMAACSRPPSASRWASWSTISAAARFSGRPVRAVQVGGPLGAYFPRALFDTPFDYEAFAARDGLIGHGGIVVFDDTVDMAKQARFAMEFCAIESCGKCTPCRVGVDAGHGGMDLIIKDDHRAANTKLLEDLCQHHEIRFVLCARRLYALSGDERA